MPQTAHVMTTDSTFSTSTTIPQQANVPDKLKPDMPKAKGSMSTDVNDNEVAQPQVTDKDSNNADLGFAAQYLVALGLGEPISDNNVLNSLNAMMSKPLDDMTKTYDNYNTPSNLENLCVPKVNMAIWENIPGTARTRD